MENEHRALIQDQFTRQAVPFANSPAIRNAEILDRIVTRTGSSPSDDVLDVGCGPGLLACAFAGVARRVTGADVTAAMLTQARAEQRRQHRSNIGWTLADATALPYADGTFSIVISRLTFHHMEQPLAVLREMARVCRNGGSVVVVDVAPAPEKAAAFNAMEKLRDPSHVRALPLDEMTALFASAGLVRPDVDRWLMEGELESFLARSFPLPGDEARVRRMFEESLIDDAMGVSPRAQDGTIVYAFPMVLVQAQVAE